jgi:Asp/Glu/hydantoin racemase
MRTDPADFDAILIDCVFDPALTALREQCPVPTFGPMQATLPFVTLVASKFAYIARAERQTMWLAEMAAKYGYEDYMAAARFMGITYEESRNPNTFDKAMIRELRHAIEDDGAEAIVFGSTTMALSEQVKAAGTVPLFMPGMVALRVMEHLWADGLLA